MPTLFIYLIKVNTVLILFYLAYRFLLRPLTFYKVNRFFLLFAIFFSTVYPFLDLSSFFRKNPEITGKLVVLAPDWQQAISPRTNTIAPVVSAYTVWNVLETLFWTGVIVLSLRLVIQLLSVYRLHRRSAPATWKEYSFRSTIENVHPFSFLRSIYLNERQLKQDELESVLSHEQVHATGWHTADVLLSELNTIFYWFNPGAWLIKISVKENLEFITDQQVLNSGADSRAYQYSLLRIGAMKPTSPIVNHFNLLTLKNRIIMMNKKRSSPLQFTKYVFLLPLVMVLAMVFTVSKAQLEKTGKSVAAVFKQATTIRLTALTEKILPEKREQPKKKESSVILPSTGESGQLSDENSLNTEDEIAVTGFPMDTVYYNVDGKPVNEISKISANDISYVQALNSEQAMKVFGSEYAKGVMFIVTKANRNSDAVLALQKKLGENNIIGSGTFRTVTISGAPEKVYTVWKGGDTTVNFNRFGKLVDDLSFPPNMQVSGNTLITTNDISAVRINGKNLVRVTGGTQVTDPTAVRNLSLTETIVNGKPLNVTTVRTAKPVVLDGKEIAAISTINGNRAPVILLDGKEITAEQQKKFPSKKIKSISVEGGVIRISTKN